MSHIINVSVKNHVAKQTDKTVYVCGNDDFVINFDFDSEWDQYDVKTARFTYGGNYVDVVFTGNTCAVPIITNVYRFKVGVFAGDLSTTTPVLISASKSILCETGTPAAPTDDVYNQIIEVVNEATTASNDAKAAAEAVTPDDTAIDGKPWTSKHIVDMLCPEINETGNPVQCYPLEGYPLKVTASWGPTQEGSGDPSPDNIRPITGRDSVSIKINGKDGTTQSSVDLTLPGTIYGGSVANDGTGTKEWEFIECPADKISEECLKDLGTCIRGWFTIELKESMFENACKSNYLPLLRQWGADSESFYIDKNVIFKIKKSRLTSEDLAGVRAYFTDNPLQMIYKATEPTAFNATGGGELTGLDGLNNVLTDADSVTVEGKEDIKHTIKELQDALASVTETEA